MAPTKKGKGKKSSKQKKNTGPDEEKYRKAVLEVDTLKQHLVLRRDMARQAMADSEGLKQRLLDLEKELEEAQGDKKDIYEEMIRKYQQLQHQTDTRIHRLEAETQNLQAQLAACQGDLLQSQLDQARMLEEKEKAVAEMQRKVDGMETEYEKILHVSLGGWRVTGCKEEIMGSACGLKLREREGVSYSHRCESLGNMHPFCGSWPAFKYRDCRIVPL
ncbi:dynein regulatory complex protein 12 isoform X1 [Podarcis muralis]